MSADCCPPGHELHRKFQGRYRTVLWIALTINAIMFAVEIVSGVKGNSVSLLADALDFLGDAANYGISLWVLAMSVSARARAALLKALSMAVFGIWVLANTFWHAHTGVMPSAPTMGTIGALALAANLSVIAMLYAYREGDSNMRSVWLCTRNDALGNLAVMLAALSVLGTGRAWPDLAVASIMASLALSSAWKVMRQAHSELAAT